jgi:hypothetical protein
MTTLSAVRGVKARRPSPPAGDQQTNSERPSRDADTCERRPPELTSGYGFRIRSNAHYEEGHVDAATPDPAGRDDIPSPAHDATILRRMTVDIWELVVRERIRDTLARYNWSGDAGRLDDLADTFCADGVLEIRGFEPLRGRSEIVAFLGGVTGNVAVSAGVKPLVRHNVANVFFDEVTRDHAQVSCYFTVVTHIGLDHVGRYRDTFTPDGGIWRIRHRKVSTDWAAPDSVMARPSH